LEDDLPNFQTVDIFRFLSLLTFHCENLSKSGSLPFIQTAVDPVDPLDVPPTNPVQARMQFVTQPFTASTTLLTWFPSLQPGPTKLLDRSLAYPQFGRSEFRIHPLAN